MNPWDKEPDELNGSYSGLLLHMRRGTFGAWCGYVGIPKEHPWFGKQYSDKVEVPDSIRNRKIDTDQVGILNLLCAAFSETETDETLSIVLALDVHGGLTYAEDHKPHQKPDGLWWFGFDCAHLGDFMPAYDDQYGIPEGTYRTAEYVKKECEKLAEQLAAFMPEKVS